MATIPFPCFFSPGDGLEEGMGNRMDQRFVPFVSLRVPCSQFSLQMAPFVCNLSRAEIYLFAFFCVRDLGSVEPVPPPVCFLQDLTQIATDGQDRIRAGAEPVQLGMGCIPLCFAEEDFLGQEAFSPERCQSQSVQILWVYRPQAHQSLPIRNTALRSRSRQVLFDFRGVQRFFVPQRGHLLVRWGLA
jgi:hypothetical protein